MRQFGTTMALALILALSLAGTNGYAQGKAKIDLGGETASTSADSQKVFAQYEGILPGENCDGIRTHLTIYVPERTYHMDETYVGVEGLSMTVQTDGTWNIMKGLKGHPEAIIYRLNNSTPAGVRYFEVMAPDSLGGKGVRALTLDLAPIDTTMNTELIRK